MFPDGGIARMRAYGVAVAALPESPHSLVDLSAATNGGVSFYDDRKSEPHVFARQLKTLFHSNKLTLFNWPGQ